MDMQHLFDFGKWIFLTGMASVFLGVGFFLQGCDRMKPTEEEKIGVMTKADSGPVVMIPPIDNPVSLKTETATFALG